MKSTGLSAFKRYFRHCLLLISLSWSLVAQAQAPSALSYPNNSVFIANETPVHLAPTVSGNVQSYALLLGTLPVGLQFDINTGVISGIPTAGQSLTTYVVGAYGQGSLLPTTTDTFTFQVNNNYYNNAGNKIAFGGNNVANVAVTAINGFTGATISNTASTTYGTSENDIVVYKKVTRIDNRDIDCIVKTVSISNGSISNYDQTSESGTGYSGNNLNFFSPFIGFSTSSRGSVLYEFQFILGDSYDLTTRSGTPVILRSVKLNTYDIDGNGSSNSQQSNDFGGFSTSELANNTLLLPPVFDAVTGLTTFKAAGTDNISATQDPQTRVRVTYDNMSTFQIRLGGLGTAYFFLDFSANGTFSTAVVTSAPSIDLNTDPIYIGVNNEEAVCGNSVSFSKNGQTNLGAPNNDIRYLTIRSAAMPQASGEFIRIAGASGSATISLTETTDVTSNFTLGGVPFEAKRLYSPATGFLIQIRKSDANDTLMSQSLAEQLLDALRYENTADQPINGERKFTVNVRSKGYQSPNAIFTANVNCLKLKGNVYHDRNGLSDNLVSNPGGASMFGDSVFVLLVDKNSDTVRRIARAQNNGAFEFGVVAPGVYKVYMRSALSLDSALVIGSVFGNTASSIPAYVTGSLGMYDYTFVSTGENLGFQPGHDGLIDGMITVTLGTDTVTYVNFGVQIPPYAADKTYTDVPNPGGYNAYPIPFIGHNDADNGFNVIEPDGSYSLVIKGFPENAYYLKVGDVVYRNPGIAGPCPPQFTTCNAWPASDSLVIQTGDFNSITVDPAFDDASTTVTINYYALDNAHARSSGENKVQITFVNQQYYGITGEVWHDKNGNGEQDTDEDHVQPADDTDILFAVLVQTNNTYSGNPTVFAVSAVSPGATNYSFTGVPGGNNYEIRLFALPAAPEAGVALSTLTPNLANGWTAVSTNVAGTIVTGLDTESPVISVNNLSGQLNLRNFGLEQAPVSVHVSSYNDIPNPAGTTRYQVPTLLGYDEEDLPPNSTSPIAKSLHGHKVVIATLPDNATLYYDGNSVSAGYEITDYDSTLLRVDPAVDGNTTVTFKFYWKDQAGVPSKQSDVTMNFTDQIIADLSMSKSVNQNQVQLGDTVTFTLTVVNNGPGDASNIKVSDVLPGAFTFISADPALAYDENTGVWTITSVDAQENAVLNITASVNANGTHTNTATITELAEVDLDETNNTDAAEVTVLPLDIRISKTVDNERPQVAGTVVFAVKVNNDGPSRATGVQVIDTLPSGYVYVSATPSPGSNFTENNGICIWEPATIAADDSAMLYITATVNAEGEYTNYATITKVSEIDTIAENNVDSVVVLPRRADLSLAKEVDSLTPLVGSNVEFTLTLTNAGPDTATGVQVLDELPDGYEFVSAEPAIDYNSTTGIWSVDSLAPLSSAELKITASVKSSGNYNNHAEVVAANEYDPDSTPGNGSTTNEDDNDEQAVTPVPVADVRVVKTGPLRIAESTDFSYTIQITNAGPSAATEIFVQDTAVANFAATSVECNSVVNCPLLPILEELQHGTFRISALDSGASVILTINGASGASGSSIANVVAVHLPPTTVDPDTMNNSDTAFTQINASVAGKVFNDLDGIYGLVPNTIDGEGTNIHGLLFAHLVDNNEQVAHSTTVNADGTFRFPSVIPGDYQVVINLSANAATPALPSDWVHTAEFVGNTAGSTSPVDGALAITVEDSNIEYVHFGIEQPPVATSQTHTAQVNPGLDKLVLVPASIFDIVDPGADGAVTYLIIDQFPANANRLVVGSDTFTSIPVGNIYVPTTSAGLPIPAIYIDPVDGAVTVPIVYTAYDSARKASNEATASMPFTTINISGTVYNDLDGLYGTPANTVNGTGTNAGGLYAVLINTETNLVDTSVAVAGNGTYSFTDRNGGDYSVMISTIAGTIGTAPAATSLLPQGWVHTGEFRGSTSGSDGAVDGKLLLGLVMDHLNEVRFGIEQPPVASNDIAAAQVNPGLNKLVAVPTSIFDVVDPGTGGAVTYLIIDQFPANANRLVVGSDTFTSIPAGNIYVPTTSAGLPIPAIYIDPVDGAVTVPIVYTAYDSARKASNEATASMPFTTINISGTVYNDLDGLYGTPANTVNGTGTNAGGLYAVLINTETNLVDTSVAVAGNGTYSFTDRNGGDYSVMISTIAGTIGTAPAATSLLPQGWVHTGEFRGSTSGSDGAVDGKLLLGLVMDHLNEVRFGIEQPPVASNDIAAAQVNPGLNKLVAVPTSIFDVVDPGTGGAVTYLIIDQFPANANRLVVGSDTFTAIPVGNIYVPTTSAGLPIPAIYIDPVDGAVTVPIVYTAYDSARKASNLGIASMPFTTIDIAGTVYYDANGLNGTPANTVDGTGTNAGGLNAILIDNESSNVVMSVPVDANGSYVFVGRNAGIYSVVISTANPAPGAAIPASSVLPAGWVHTGEKVGAGAGSDAPIDGRLSLGYLGTNLNNVRFGIDQLPVATDSTLAPQPNPGVYNTVAVPAAAFQTADAAPGAVTTIVITAMPANAFSLTVGSTVYNYATPVPPLGISIPANPLTGQPLEPIFIDPMDGGVTVAIPYYAIDLAGNHSNSATVRLPFTSYHIAGKVVHDANGLKGVPANTVDGPGITVSNLRAVLVRNTENIVVGVTNVAADGTFNFEDVNSGDHKVLITTAGIFSNLVPLLTLPSGWVYTGEFMGIGAGSDGAPNGTFNLGMVLADKENIRFGIQQLPVAHDASPVYHLNPGGSNTVPVPTLSGTDAEDGSLASGNSFIITTSPVNGTLYYNGQQVLSGDTIHNYSPASLRLDPFDSNIVVQFQYSVLDIAGFADPTPATVTLVFEAISLSGNVYNDANGMNDNLVNGTAINMASGAQLYANLIDPSAGNDVLAVAEVQADGTFYFSTVPPNTNLEVQISVENAQYGAVLPAGWVFTGEQLGAVPGHDGSIDGTLAIATGADPEGISNANFGLERLPVAEDKFVTINPVVLNTAYPLTDAPLSGSDPEDGVCASGSRFVFGTQPNCCAEVRYNGVLLDQGTIITNYNPALLTITFTNLVQNSVVFTYAVMDAAGRTGNFANYVVTTGTVLPVVWSRFTAQAEEAQAKLSWTTAEERHNTGFVVERSADGLVFNEIGFVATAADQGNSTDATDYLYYDKQPLAGTNYYRLKQVDIDGTFYFSEVRSVQFATTAMNIRIYPNPASEVVFVEVTDPSKVKAVRMSDFSGREVYRSKELSAEGIDMGRMAQGTYLLQIEQLDGTISNFKVVKK
jgi:uncharacterized repeat protein (TIGR01451 family)